MLLSVIMISAAAAGTVRVSQPSPKVATQSTATGNVLAKPGEPADTATVTPPLAIVIPTAITAQERALVRLEVLLDRAHFSPGVIDGKPGANLKLALTAYAATHDLPNGDDVAALTTKLVADDSAVTVKAYTITDTDVAGPYVEHLPTDLTDLAKLDSPAYSGPVEALAERFHMDEALLRALNPRAEFAKAGTVVIVAAVDSAKLSKPVTRIEVDKTTNAVRAFAGDTLLAVYPATVGSTERPAPTGMWKVRTIATKATYTFDPKRLTFGKAGVGKLTIKAGPNNPIGTTWIDLTKDTYGIHGTPDPRLIGKRASHGCVRLTNWDVEQLARAVKAGATVEFTGIETRKKT